MNQPRTIDPATPLTARLGNALLYPLRGAALAALAALASGLLLADLLPWLIGVLVWVIAWVGTYMYALECLRHSAEGYADPPEISVNASTSAALLLFALQMLGLYAIKIAYNTYQDAFFIPLLMAVILPTLTMSLAFGDSLLGALDPRRLFAAMAGFGAAYLLPVLTGLLQSLAYVGSLSHGHGFVASALWLVIVVYAVLFNFHVMGMLMHRFHERMGYTPETEQLAFATGRDKDQELLARVHSLTASGNPSSAIALLAERINEAHAPYAVHAHYRKLLREEGREQALLANAHTCIASMMLEHDPRRALGVVRECMDIDPGFMPDEPAVAGTLAEAAAHSGMNRLALKLARGYPNTWPRDPASPRYGLMAARLMAERLDQPAEAGVLASKLLIAFPDCSERPQIQDFLAQLNGGAKA